MQPIIAAIMGLDISLRTSVSVLDDVLACFVVAATQLPVWCRMLMHPPTISHQILGRFFYLCSPFVARFKRCSKRPQFDWNAATERNNNEPFYSSYKKRKKGTSCKWSRISSSAPVKPIWGLQHKLCLCCAGSLCIADEGLFSRLHDGRTIDVTYAALLLEHSVRVVGNEAKIFGKTAFVLVRMRLSSDIMFDTALFYVYIAQWNHWFICFPYFLSVQTLTLCAIHFETMIL